MLQKSCPREVHWGQIKRSLNPGHGFPKNSAICVAAEERAGAPLCMTLVMLLFIDSMVFAPWRQRGRHVFLVFVSEYIVFYSEQLASVFGTLWNLYLIRFSLSDRLLESWEQMRSLISLVWRTLCNRSLLSLVLALIYIPAFDFFFSPPFLVHLFLFCVILLYLVVETWILFVTR